MPEGLEERYGRCSTIATSQRPIEEWLVHNAYKINLRGESMRKRQAKLTDTTASE
ncbi:IstB helper protein, IS21 family [Marinobacter sp. ELB17]|nr:IstB helper protein, IS21 family [Marinobacter sp. ELB17]